MTDDQLIKVTVDAEAADNLTWAEFAMMTDFSRPNSGVLMGDVIATLDKVCKVSIDGKALGSVGEITRRHLGEALAEILGAVTSVSDSKN
jgi:hypothetical protein